MMTKQECAFKVCHTCRPFYRDRSFVSFGQVFSNEILPPSEWMPSTMPCVNRAVVCTLGLGKPWDFSATSSEASEASGSVVEDEQTRKTAFSSKVYSRERLLDLGKQWQKSYVGPLFTNDRSASHGFRDSLQKSLHNMMVSSGEELFASRQLNTNGNASISKSSNESADSFDLELWKFLSEKLLRQAASIELPGNDSHDLELVDIDTKDHMTKVVGLTEESAENHACDVIMSV